MFVAGDVTLDNYQDPDWDKEPEVNGYVHALVTGGVAGRGDRSSSDATPRRCAPADAAWTAPQAARHPETRRHRLREGSFAESRRKSARQPGSRTPARRARWSPSTTPPARSRPWSADAISISPSSIAPPRRCARSDRPSNPTSTPRPSIGRHARRHDPRCARHFPHAVRPVHSAQLRREI